MTERTEPAPRTASRAEALYRAYWQSRWDHYQQGPALQWEQLDESERLHWQAVAEAAEQSGPLDVDWSVMAEAARAALTATENERPTDTANWLGYEGTIAASMAAEMFADFMRAEYARLVPQPARPDEDWSEPQHPGYGAPAQPADTALEDVLDNVMVVPDPVYWNGYRDGKAAANRLARPADTALREAAEAVGRYAWGTHLAGTPNEIDAIGLIESLRVALRNDRLDPYHLPCGHDAAAQFWGRCPQCAAGSAAQPTSAEGKK